MGKKKINYWWELVNRSVLGIFGLLIICLICPVASSAEAAEVTDVIRTGVNTNATAYVRSTVSVAVTSEVDFDLTPHSQGIFGTSGAELTVATNNTTGYAVYLQTKDDSQSLKATNPEVSNRISAVNGTMTPKDFSANLNTWGYAIADMASDDTIYRAIPKSSDPAIIKTDRTSSSDTYKLSFGVAIGADLPAGVYTGQLVASVVANPIEVRGINDITYMQDMTPEICQVSFEDETKQLIDTRDGKKYWVAKLADGKCWMTQNLAYNLDPAKTLTPGDSDVKANWTPSVATQTEQAFQNADRAGQDSYNPGQYAINNPNGYVGCGAPGGKMLTLQPCVAQGIVTDVSQFAPTMVASETVAVDSESKVYDAHYLVGNYYQFNAVTAGGTDESNYIAGSSVCPKGWRLPGNATWANNSVVLEQSESYQLLKAYGWTGKQTLNGYNWNVMAGPDAVSPFIRPIYLAKAGVIYSDIFNGSSREGIIGVGYQSETWLNIIGKYNTEFPARFQTFAMGESYLSSSQWAVSFDNRSAGYSVRCIAR